MKKLILLTSVAILAINISASLAATSGCDCGDDCCWEFDSSTGKLTITGSGAMKDFGQGNFTPWYNKCSEITSVNITGVTSVGKNAFAGYYSNIASVDMPNVTELGQSAFKGATSLTSVDMPNVTTIGRDAFNNAWSLTSVDMPKVETIGMQAFMGASALTSVNMPKVTELGQSAFANLYSLTSVDMPNVASIGNNAFGMALSLTSVDMPNVASIGDNAFSMANKLSYVEIPNKKDNEGCLVNSDGERLTTETSNCLTNITLGYGASSQISSCSANNYAACNVCNKSGSSGSYFQPYAAGGGGECQSSCNGGYTASNGLCKKNPDVTIPQNCRVYNDGCAQCSTGYLSKEGGCVEPSACTGEYIVDSENGLCKKMPGCLNYADGACGGCERGFYKKEGGCVSSEEGCGSGYLEKDSVCISSANGCGAGYKQIENWCNRIQYTPAEAAPLLKDDGNFVILTFKK